MEHQRKRPLFVRRMTESGPGESGNTIVQLEPSARFLPARSLRRVIRFARDRANLEVRVIHDRFWWTSRDELFADLTPAELGLTENEPAELLLLPLEASHATPREVWRLLFHARIDHAIDRAIATAQISAEELRAWRRSLGETQWYEVRSVLHSERLVDENDPDRHAYRELGAFVLELMHFEPDSLAVYFPGLRSPEKAIAPVLSFIDVPALLESTRPPGLSQSIAPPPAPDVPRWPNGPAQPALAEKAKVLSGQGNDLRAATLLFQAQEPDAVLMADRLATRIATVVDDSDPTPWRDAIRDLVPEAAAGGRPIAWRLLYDLQRACIAVEKVTYAADLIEWTVTFGRRPIKRELTKPKWLDVARRLRTAATRAERLHRHALAVRLVNAAHHAEQRARAELRPEIVAVLDEVGLVARNVAEEHSRSKLVDELLDNACARGFLRIGDLRDAIARNRVKLPDLSSPGELIWGDPLLRANAKLAERLDGVYRRGELYMRLLQRGCSLFFGTRVGRSLTRYVALPVGGAFVLLEGLHHMVEAVEGLVHWVDGTSAQLKAFSHVAGGAAGTVAANPGLESGGVSLMWLGIVTVILFGLIHWPAFRRQTIHLAGFLLYKAPRTIAHSPIVRALISNPITRFFRRYVLLPAFFGSLSALTIWLIYRSPTCASLVGSGVAVLVATLFRTPTGRLLEDRLNETAERVWRVISVNFLLGALSLVVAWFKALFDAIDRGLYAVDEWLRFREGESRGAFAFKLAFGTVWFVFTYLFRFAWNLLVEPQINPIKHFPVVTVSHKMLLPLVPSLAKQFGTSPETMGLLVSGVPGIFGFLVWELKENWKLYRASAPADLRPVIIGSHGEKMRALLRPGFHSGVIPKTYAKLRKATREGHADKAAKHHHHLEHAAEAIHRLIERDLLSYLHHSKRWGGAPIHAAMPRLATNRVRVPLTSTKHDGEVIVSFEERGGWVIASVEESGWLPRLNDHQREAFADALLGLYKLTGTHAVREQLGVVLEHDPLQIDAIPEGLLVIDEHGRTVLFDYSDGPELISPDRHLPMDSAVLSERPLSWDLWAEQWTADADGKPTQPLLPGWRVLA